jgi:hypothetical protein
MRTSEKIGDALVDLPFLASALPLSYEDPGCEATKEAITTFKEVLLNPTERGAWILLPRDICTSE